jgi:hypothetical protein
MFLRFWVIMAVTECCGLVLRDAVWFGRCVPSYTASHARSRFDPAS